METLFSGLAIGESPRWHNGRLWLSNWGAQEVLAIDVDGTPRYGECPERVGLFDRLAA